MPTISGRPKNEEEALKLVRRLGWYVVGRKCRLRGPIEWDHAHYTGEPFTVIGVRPYFVNKGDIQNYGWWFRLSTNYLNPRHYVDIRKFNDLEVLG